MEKLDLLEQKVLSAVTKINQIEADRKELERRFDAKSAEVEALELEKKHLLGEIEELKELRDENERLRENIEAARKRVEGIISKIEAAGVDEGDEGDEGTDAEKAPETEPVETADTDDEEPGSEKVSDGPDEEGEVSESIFDDE
jgi:chromosome segregation ATPase